MTIVACLLIAAAATAQGVKVSAKMEKGMKKTYQSEIVMNVGGKEVKFGAKQNYVVADRLPDGYRVDCSTSDFTSNVTDDDVMGMLILLGQQMNEGMTVSLKTDDDGKVLGLLNGDEVRQHGMDTFDVLLNRLFEKHPEAAQMMPREALKAQVTAPAQRRQPPPERAGVHQHPRTQRPADHDWQPGGARQHVGSEDAAHLLPHQEGRLDDHHLVEDEHDEGRD